ncbi:ZinT/AdcA family metal-binding protein [Halanaerobium salsuginis]|jgi:hypothetical protein|uniref:ZinT (YodA) lipocalin-like zinc-recruitment n=1 Tax=Halanaerobium salsuginis TaxID=29563 RepID=A0A1I4IUY2_9FIRM|nr:ZinT/AdcA family metal-binding protein [Halanaerobium salsuginis]SFL57877.1 ZinT (YodA) lipocalin-like zinc-recruitment [Halanaerobium salsuginis]
MKNKKAIILMMILVGVLFSFSNLTLAAETETGAINDLMPWQGTNQAFIKLFDTPASAEFFSAVADYAEGYDSQAVRQAFAELYNASFSEMEVVDAKTVIFDQQLKAEYDYLGNLNTSWGEYSISWYIFKTADQAAIAAGFKYLMFVPYHQDGEDGLRHCHMRYGNPNFDYLATDPSLANWWPTLFEKGQVNKEKIVKNMVKQARLYSTMLPVKTK